MEGSQQHRLPLPRVLLTIFGYGALPYEKTSHSSTPKLHTSDLLENRCWGRGQGEEVPVTSLDTSYPEPRGSCREGGMK